MATVFIVRHAMPTVNPKLSPAGWELSIEGRAAARALQGRLPLDVPRVASAERKSQQTLALALPGQFAIDERFNEVRRPPEPIGGDVRPVRRAWVEGMLDERHVGWETPSEAAARFDAAVRASTTNGIVVATDIP